MRQNFCEKISAAAEKMIIFYSALGTFGNIIRREIENKLVDIIVDNGEGSIKELSCTAAPDIKIETVYSISKLSLIHI